jgi:hypothetical protein
MIKLSLDPLDKFKEEKNIERTYEYVDHLIADYDIHCIKFGNEKYLKNRELLECKVQWRPLTGTVETITVDPNFCNGYSIIGFCSINTDLDGPFNFTSLIEPTMQLSLLMPSSEQSRKFILFLGMFWC